MFSAAAFVLFAVVCSVLAFRRHPIYGLYFYLATTYVHPPSRWWNYILPDLRWALLSAVVCVLAVAFHRGRLSQRPPWTSSAPAIILSLYAAWMWLQTPWALSVEEHLNGTVLFTKYILAFWFIYRIADTKELIRDVMLFHAAGCAMLGLMARLSHRDFGRVEGVGGPGIDDANSLGMFLATGAVVCIALLLSQRGWRRLLAICLLPLLLEGFVVTNSRGAFLGLAMGVAVLLFARSVAYNKAMLTLGVVVALVAAVAVDQKFIDRMSTIGDVTSESVDAEMSARSRVTLMRAQLEMARDHPMGVGHRGTVELSPQYLDRIWLDHGGRDPDSGRSSHNAFLSALVEQGVLGALLFLILVGWVVRTIWRVRSMRRRDDDPELVMLAAGLCGALGVVFVAGLATDYLTTEVQFWLFACLVSAIKLLSPVAQARPAGAGRAVEIDASLRPAQKQRQA